MRPLPRTEANAKANRSQSAEDILRNYYDGLLRAETAEEYLISAGYEQAQARRMVNRMDRVKVPPRWAGLLRKRVYQGRGQLESEGYIDAETEQS